MDLSENLNFIDFIKKVRSNKRSDIVCLPYNDESSIYCLILIVKFHSELRVCVCMCERVFFFLA